MLLFSLARKAVSAYLRLCKDALLLISGVHLARFAWRQAKQLRERAVTAAVDCLGEWLVTRFFSDGTERTSPSRPAHGGRAPSTQTACDSGRHTWRLDSVRYLLKPLYISTSCMKSLVAIVLDSSL